MIPLPCRLTRDHGHLGIEAIGHLLAVGREEHIAPRYLVHAGTAEPLRVSPPEAVAYLLELLTN